LTALSTKTANVIKKEGSTNEWCGGRKRMRNGKREKEKWREKSLPPS
jgi:hypothetical protein